MIDTFRIGAVILAGGRGSRMHSAIQKQYMLLNGRPLISYALEAFEQSCADELVLVTGAGPGPYQAARCCDRRKRTISFGI